jgi:hypothetical protein
LVQFTLQAITFGLELEDTLDAGEVNSFSGEFSNLAESKHITHAV